MKVDGCRGINLIHRGSGKFLYMYEHLIIELQARTQPFSKGGYRDGGVVQIGTCMMWALAHSPPRGVWGHAPPENFGNNIIDSLRAILRHSDMYNSR